MKVSTGSLVVAAGLTVVAAVDPLTIKLEGRRNVRRTEALRSHKRSSELNLDLGIWREQADYQWYGKVSVGTPAQDFNVIFDTGSLDLVLPKKGCTTCSNYTLFDPSKSSTFSAKPGHPFSAGYGTAGDAQPLAKPATANGTIVADVVSINGAAVSNQTFLLCDAYPDELGDNPLGPKIDGIFGLGPPGSSIFTQAYNQSFTTAFWNLVSEGKVPEPVFSFYLNSGSDESYGELTLGGTDPSKYQGDITTVGFNKTVTAMIGEWFIDTPTFFVDSKSVKDSDSGDAFPAGVSLLDTGTAYIQTPDYQTAKDIYAAISPDIEQLDELGVWGAPCDVMEKLAPELTFTLGSGDKTVNLTMPKEAFNLGEHASHPGKCQGVLLNSPEPLSDLASVWVIGSPLLKGYYTVWDGENLQLGVAQLKGSSTSSNTSSSDAGSNTPVPTAGAAGSTPRLWGFAAAAFALMAAW